MSLQKITNYLTRVILYIHLFIPQIPVIAHFIAVTLPVEEEFLKSSNSVLQHVFYE